MEQLILGFPTISSFPSPKSSHRLSLLPFHLPANLPIIFPLVFSFPSSLPPIGSIYLQNWTELCSTSHQARLCCMMGPVAWWGMCKDLRRTLHFFQGSPSLCYLQFPSSRQPPYHLPFSCFLHSILPFTCPPSSTIFMYLIYTLSFSTMQTQSTFQ